MDFETMPTWFWNGYYFVLLITILVSAYSLMCFKFKIASVLTLFFSVTVPLYSLIHSFERGSGLNEWEYLFQELQLGTFWALYAGVGYVYLIVWWIVYVIKIRKT